MNRDEVSQRLRKLVDTYRQHTGQPRLSTRGLTAQMRAEGVHISHGTLQNMLNGTTKPDASTLQGLCSFFGVSTYHFDAEPEKAVIMGRIKNMDLGADELGALGRLLDELAPEGDAGTRGEGD